MNPDHFPHDNRIEYKYTTFPEVARVLVQLLRDEFTNSPKRAAHILQGGVAALQTETRHLAFDIPSIDRVLETGVEGLTNDNLVKATEEVGEEVFGAFQ